MIRIRYALCCPANFFWGALFGPFFFVFFRLRFSCVCLCADLRVPTTFQRKSLLEARVDTCARLGGPNNIVG